MTKRWVYAAWLVGLMISLTTHAESRGDAPRGELLYTTHCIACHNEKIHWRDRKIATDWNSLKAQVYRWQGVAGLAWNDDDIVEVARYLNTRHYHYPEHVQ